MTKRMSTGGRRLIESDQFPVEFLSTLAERESWRKELHRPVYHVHKWWATRLGSVFRGILLGCVLEETDDLRSELYRLHSIGTVSVFDPFMGSGTTIGEAHKLGMAALGRDINPVAVQAARTAFGPLDRDRLADAFRLLSKGVGERIRSLYHSVDSRGRRCDVLYFFWVMQAICPICQNVVDLFRSYIVGRNAAPRRNSEVQILCPSCGTIFSGWKSERTATCPQCRHGFNPHEGTTHGKHAVCRSCTHQFSIRDSIARRQTPPEYRLFGKLVLTSSGGKEYLAATAEDRQSFAQCSGMLRQAIASGEIDLPDLELSDGYNTRQAMGYGFRNWRSFFNDRQLLALGWLRRGIDDVSDSEVRQALLTLFSGVLEFNNMFASYKGEGTGAVRHMFSHHILKPERSPIEANVWGTPKSSGSFSGMFQSRLIRAVAYREEPTEVNGRRGASRICSPSFEGAVEREWPGDGRLRSRSIYLSCGDSADTGLRSASIDLVVTDPPFFDNVHYSELADFFFAWHQPAKTEPRGTAQSTRHVGEVQDTDAASFSDKLTRVFAECARVLTDDGLLVFTYHHSRTEGWESLAAAIGHAGFRVVNAHPVRSELSVATPKSQAKDPITLDMIIVCRKDDRHEPPTSTVSDTMKSARDKIRRLLGEGFELSQNDKRIAFLGQLLTAISTPVEWHALATQIESEISRNFTIDNVRPAKCRQQTLF
ncbi:MAG: adenine-specific DNA methylase [Planctomycetaceae bacterium]